jgi:mannose-6-phosphate isomerase-like protein (cupin superfamily)
MNTAMLPVIDVMETTRLVDSYQNNPVAAVNDHVVRLSVMTEPYFWHFHPDSDESFLVMDGILVIELEDRMIELLPNQLFTIPKNVIHRTRPKGNRSVNLTFEGKDLTTTQIERKA